MAAAAAVAHVQGARGVGRDEFDHHFCALATVVGAVRLACIEDGREFRLVSGGRQEEIDEAGTCDLGLGHEPDCLGRALMISSASSRGLLPAVLESARATLVAKSPCLRSRVRSTSTPAGAA